MFDPEDISIIDYGMGNLFSVQQACEQVGLKAKVTSKKEDLLKGRAAILPGVGAFGDAMANLTDLDLVSAIGEFINTNRPFLGICLGMQLLMTESEEFGNHRGLGIIEGKVLRFPFRPGNPEKVPQIGWNHIRRPALYKSDPWVGSPLRSVSDGEFMYFVHSYYCRPVNEGIVLSLTKYADVEYVSSIFWKNIFACQFHPERSAEAGLKIYRDWSLFIEQRSD